MQTRLLPRSRRSAAATAVLMTCALVVAGCSSEEASPDATSTTIAKFSTTTAGGSTTEGGSTTTGPDTTTTSEPGSDLTGQAIFPAPGDTEFDDPQEVAVAFAQDYLGFPDPHPGAFQEGDTRSGEVPVQPKDSGPTTTVLVRSDEDGVWSVIGATTPNISLESPSALAEVSSPVTLSGQSTAFEATVNVEIRQDGSADPLAKGFVMGGANGEMGPFSKEFTFKDPTEDAGAIVLLTYSAEDGSVQEAAVTRVTFAS